MEAEVLTRLAPLLDGLRGTRVMLDSEAARRPNYNGTIFAAADVAKQEEC